MGNMTKDFVPVGKEEQAEIKDDVNAHKVADLCGIDCEWMINYFCKPKLKVGTEWVSKGSTCNGASSSVGGISRKVYELVFRFITEKCNLTLYDPVMKKVQYIGCLDIAGFEIFDYNGFEQICINFVNEKLQQFFNQHMFTLEQEEYVREGIEWANVDFGMDLQVCITMFEKPMGLLAIFEEESLFPKATDDTFSGKLQDNLFGKPACANFGKPDPKAPDKKAHFSVIHYAATVSYNLTGWLDKNKDPLNDTVVELMKQGSNPLLVECFHDHPGQPMEVKKDAGGPPKKKGGGKTVTSFFKSQLDDLMKVLYATDPSFIRCVVPNTHKKPGMVQAELIMHQYQCNGVLAGIAICRLGFPNKLMYPDFKARYNILAAGAVAKAKNDKNAAGAVMEAISFPKEKYRLGHTKIFFRAGMLGDMEEAREEKIGSVLAGMQAQARGKASRLVFKKMQDQKLALYCLQRTIRNYRIGKTWKWWTLWLGVKPNLKCTKFAMYKAEYEEKIAIAEANIDKAVEECNKVTAVHDTLLATKNEYVMALQSGGSAVQDIIDKTNRLEGMKNEVQKQLSDTNIRVKAEEDQKASIEAQSSKVTSDANKLRSEIKVMESNMEATEEDKLTKDSQIRTLKEEIAHQEELIAKLTKDKRSIGDGRQKTEEDIQSMEDKCNHLNKVKGKLEQSLDECEDSLEREKKSKGDVEKIKRKVEGDLKLTQEAVSDLERIKSELGQTVQRKEKELSSMSAKIEDEQTLGSKYSRQIKELQTRLEEVDEELAIERQNRAKAEKNRSLLSRDIEDLGQRLEDAGNNTATQIELNKKRETELAKLKGELEESNISHEGTLAALRQKHNSNMAELGEQIDGLNKNKAKSEKDKSGMERDLQEARQGLDEAMRERANHERNGKLSQGLIVEAHQKLDEMARALNEADSSKKKLQVENQDLCRQIEETENAIASLGKSKISLTTQLEDTKRLGDSEARDRASLLSKFKSMTTDVRFVLT
jgi:myosin heavy chain 6/7